MIDSLWRDVSMGADHVSAGSIRAIHKDLGEIGSELFGRIFTSKSLPHQVKFLCQIWLSDLTFRGRR